MNADFGEYWRSHARGRHFRIRVVAHGERSLLIQQSQELINASHGDILDFKEFSNLSLNCIVEITAPNLLSLVDSLRAAGWNVDTIPDRETLKAAAATPLEGTVQLTFADGDGELKIVVPAVPG